MIEQGGLWPGLPMTSTGEHTAIKPRKTAAVSVVCPGRCILLLPLLTVETTKINYFAVSRSAHAL